mmetsp:Transcript_7990/g.22629  ORF Transcript_7990/g.22629 Transcript_7990/m.22629 type:complete len:239 (-) Transcript_7990:891-1607(-)
MVVTRSHEMGTPWKVAPRKSPIVSSWQGTGSAAAVSEVANFFTSFTSSRSWDSFFLVDSSWFPNCRYSFRSSRFSLFIISPSEWVVSSTFLIRSCRSSRTSRKCPKSHGVSDTTTASEVAPSSSGCTIRSLNSMRLSIVSKELRRFATCSANSTTVACANTCRSDFCSFREALRFSSSFANAVCCVLVSTKLLENCDTTSTYCCRKSSSQTSMRDWLSSTCFTLWVSDARRLWCPRRP